MLLHELKIKLRPVVWTGLLLLSSLSAAALPPEPGGRPVAAVQPEPTVAVQPEPKAAVRSRFPSVYSVARYLNAGFLLFLLASHPSLPGSEAQGLPGLSLPSLPAFNLSAPDPVSSFVAQGVNQALARANSTGSLPPLAELNPLLANNNPLQASVLATLPVQVNPAPPAAATAATTPAGGSPLSVEMTAALTTLDIAQLTEAFNILKGIGLQLIGDGYIFINNTNLSAALRAAGNELEGLGHVYGAMASEVRVDATQQLITAMQSRPSPADPGAAIEPEVIYGTWQRLETTEPRSLVLYKFTREEFVRISAVPTGNGNRRVSTENHPGAVTAYVSYEVPGEDFSFDQALGAIKVTVQIEASDCKLLTFDFSFLRARGKDVEGDGEVLVDVLVETAGERKAFVRVSKH